MTGRPLALVSPGTPVLGQITRPPHPPVSPDIRVGRRSLGGTGTAYVLDDDGDLLCTVISDVRADLFDDDVKSAVESLWAAFRLARHRREHAQASG